MPHSNNRRGRPKGSGIDDRAVLRRIGDMIEADPTLKPTTAIKAIGVSDPSTIRRLRDKFKAGDDHDLPLPAPSSGACVGVAAPMLPLFEARRVSDVPQSVRPSCADMQGLAEVSAVSAAEDSSRWLLSLYALGLSAFSSTIRAQMSLMDDFLHVPQVESALRHQLLLNEVAKAFCPKRADVRTTFH